MYLPGSGMAISGLGGGAGSSSTAIPTAPSCRVSVASPEPSPIEPRARSFRPAPGDMGGMETAGDSSSPATRRRSSPSVSTWSSIPSSEIMPSRSSMAAANCTRPRLSRCRSSLRCSSSPTPGCCSPEIWAMSVNNQSSDAANVSVCGLAVPLPEAAAVD